MNTGATPTTRHFLSDLCMEAEVISESRARVRIPVTPAHPRSRWRCPGRGAGHAGGRGGWIGGPTVAAPRLVGHRRPDHSIAAPGPRSLRRGPGDRAEAGSDHPGRRGPRGRRSRKRIRGGRCRRRAPPGGVGHHDLRHPSRADRRPDGERLLRFPGPMVDERTGTGRSGGRRAAHPGRGPRCRPGSRFLCASTCATRSAPCRAV